MEGKNRAAIFIDGSNFYFKIKSLGVKNLSKYGYRKLCEDLAGTREIVAMGYYVGVVRAAIDDSIGQRKRMAQRNLFNHLRDSRIIVHKGYIMKNNGKFHEKGVDVKISVDLLAGAYENLYDDAIVISSDTDLLPAMQKVKQLGKNVEYVGFGHQPTLALQTAATRSRLLLIEELEKFVFKDK